MLMERLVTALDYSSQVHVIRGTKIIHLFLWRTMFMLYGEGLENLGWEFCKVFSNERLNYKKPKMRSFLDYSMSFISC